MVKKKCVKKKCIKKNYVQTKDKKKVCPRCNGRVFNGTKKCKLLKNNIVCAYSFISRREAKLKYVFKHDLNTIEKTVEDIKYINNLAKHHDIACLSPYKIKEHKKIIIPSKNIIKKFDF